jgi:putative two-component system response regulator
MAEETLLIVEDNDVLRDGLHDMLTYEGFSVVTARNGREALALLKSITPELIVSDITMPVMDGLDFYRAVREQPTWVTIPFIFLTARADPKDFLVGRNLGVDDYLTKPINREELVTAVRSRLARSRQIQVAQLQQAYLGSLTALANAVDIRDRYTVGHVERVTAYAVTLAQYLGWKERQIEVLRFGSILHDIGKLHVSEATLFKKTPLTDEEWEEIKRHPVIGAEMIRNIPYLIEAIPIVRHHHEQWNGKGYPDGLAGDAIPEGARIVKLADTIDAMMTDRPYAPAIPLEKVACEIHLLSGKVYDPKVVEAFQHTWETGQIQAIATKP